MFRRCTIALALAIAAASPTHGAEIGGSAFSSGNWNGSAYEEAGIFSHCAMSVSYGSGIRLHFAIDNEYLWRMGFSHETWKYEVGETVAVEYKIDRRQYVYVEGKAALDNFVLAELDAKDELFAQFRRGNMLYVLIDGEEYTFSLKGTSNALSRVLACVNDYQDWYDPAATADAATPPEPAPQPAEPSPPSPPGVESGSDVFAQSPQDVLDATRFVIRLFAASEFASYRVLDEVADEPDTSVFLKDAAVAWQSDSGNGALHVMKSETISRDKVVAELIAADSRHCKGYFASGKGPSEHNPDLLTAFTACKSGDTYDFHADYLVFTNAGGKTYRMTNLQTATKDVRREAAEALSRNVGLMLER